jgi:hypothetical protein
MSQKKLKVNIFYHINYVSNKSNNKGVSTISHFEEVSTKIIKIKISNIVNKNNNNLIQTENSSNIYLYHGPTKLMDTTYIVNVYTNQYYGYKLIKNINWKLVKIKSQHLYTISCDKQVNWNKKSANEYNKKYVSSLILKLGRCYFITYENFVSCKVSNFYIKNIINADELTYTPRKISIKNIIHASYNTLDLIIIEDTNNDHISYCCLKSKISSDINGQYCNILYCPHVEFERKSQGGICYPLIAITYIK